MVVLGRHRHTHTRTHKCRQDGFVDGSGHVDADVRALLSELGMDPSLADQRDSQGRCVLYTPSFCL